MGVPQSLKTPYKITKNHLHVSCLWGEVVYSFGRNNSVSARTALIIHGCFNSSQGALHCTCDRSSMKIKPTLSARTVLIMQGFRLPNTKTTWTVNYLYFFFHALRAWRPNYFVRSCISLVLLVVCCHYMGSNTEHSVVIHVNDLHLTSWSSQILLIDPTWIEVIWDLAWLGQHYLWLDFQFFSSHSSVKQTISIANKMYWMLSLVITIVTKRGWGCTFDCIFYFQQYKVKDGQQSYRKLTDFMCWWRLTCTFYFLN